ncbi:MAG: hypothetical protein MRZ79_24080 [Bacteroidia bacterium]|nr:hypothetical protein [Bacteroidia bacterium]
MYPTKALSNLHLKNFILALGEASNEEDAMEWRPSDVSKKTESSNEVDMDYNQLDDLIDRLNLI